MLGHDDLESTMRYLGAQRTDILQAQIEPIDSLQLMGSWSRKNVGEVGHQAAKIQSRESIAKVHCWRWRLMTGLTLTEYSQ